MTAFFVVLVLGSGVAFAKDAGMPAETIVGQMSKPEQLADCGAGYWARAIADVPGTSVPLVLANAPNINDAARRFRLCNPQAYNISYFMEGVRWVCAPFSICTAN